MITAAEMQKHMLERPFRPIRVCLKDGRRFDLHDPTWNLAAEAIFLIGVAPEDDPRSRFPDRHEWVDYRLIRSVEPLASTSGQ